MSEQTVDMSLAALTELVERHRRMLHQWEEWEQRIDALIAGTRSLGRLVIAENREALDALAELDDSGDYGDFKRQLLRDPATKDAYERRQNVGERSNQRTEGGNMSLAEQAEQQRVEHRRAIDLAYELRGEVEGLLGDAVFYGRAFERAVTIAGQRIAAAEAEVERLTRRCAYLEAQRLERSDPASRSAAAHQDADFPPDAPRVKRDASIAPRLVGSDKNAASHAERGKR